MNNPLTQSRYRTMAVQAPIVGKVFPDTYEIERREYESKDATNAATVVPGGDKNVNFSCMPGEICLSRVYEGNSGYMDSRYEVGLTSAAGLVANKSYEAIHREHRFLGGVGENGYEHGGDGMYGTDPLEHGYAIIRSGGPFTTNNWYNGSIQAGQLLEFAIPLPGGVPGEETSRPPVVDTGSNAINLSIRSGTPLQKPLYYLKPCDPSSFETSLAAIYWCMNHDSAEGGIRNLANDEYFNNPDKYTNLQLESFELSMALTGLFNTAHSCTNDANGKTEFLGKVFGRHVASDAENRPHSENMKRDVKKTWTTATTINDKDLFTRDKILPLLAKSFTGQLRAKMSRVVGVSLSNAKPGETLDVLIRPAN